ncbi:hypothetical protein PF004_g22738 [Phytophthora fragariae]|uniref:Uncharacterized protein n=1 Tax=Phytophthora fragariae TaxID=53985 RepID=A0A6G0N0N5_9STRA|nr:hypothetical protein PF004_g22738 [Phytophthora fragariae]
MVAGREAEHSAQALHNLERVVRRRVRGRAERQGRHCAQRDHGVDLRRTLRSDMVVEHKGLKLLVFPATSQTT